MPKGKMGFQKGNKEGAKSNRGHTALVEQMRKTLIEHVNRELPEILRAQMDLAKGLVIQKTITLKDGKVIDRYYKERPSEQAAKYLMDQSMGRAKETVEHQGDSLSLTMIVKKLENGE